MWDKRAKVIAFSIESVVRSLENNSRPSFSTSNNSGGLFLVARRPSGLISRRPYREKQGVAHKYTQATSDLLIPGWVNSQLFFSPQSNLFFYDFSAHVRLSRDNRPMENWCFSPCLSVVSSVNKFSRYSEKRVLLCPHTEMFL